MTETLTPEPGRAESGSYGLEFRESEILGVDFPQRTIDLVVMPYEAEALVAHHGRMVTEICSRGAFDGIERRAQRVKVNRDHDVSRTVGRAVAFHPSRREGLIAEVRISRTELGDETLTLADDGVLDASAGFAPLWDERSKRIVPGAITWLSKTARRLNKLWLGHIALVPDPAYDSATVLAVRNVEPVSGEATATPNLDRLQAEHWRKVEAQLDARYIR